MLIVKDIKYIVMFKNYNLGILFFNLLPIYPLDGGKLIRIIFEYFVNIKKSFIYTIFLSLIIIVIMCFKYNNISMYLMLILLIIKIIDEVRKYKYYYNNMIIERYLKKIKYKKYKIIHSIDNLYKNRNHLFYINNKYLTEEDYLKRKYEHR